MRAEIVSVGTELLLGQIIDTNAAYLAQRLAEIGIDVYFKQTARPCSSCASPRSTSRAPPSAGGGPKRYTPRYRWRVSVDCSNSEGVPSNTTRPLLSTKTRSATVNASRKFCSTSKKDRPSCL